MGFSVTASYIIFGVALLGAFSVASEAYWKNAATLEEGQRSLQQRAVKESHANVTLSAVAWNAGTSVESFTVANSGTTTLDIARLQYMFDGVLSFASQSAGYPKLNGINPPGSDLLLAGDG